MWNLICRIVFPGNQAVAGNVAPVEYSRGISSKKKTGYEQYCS